MLDFGSIFVLFILLEVYIFLSFLATSCRFLVQRFITDRQPFLTSFLVLCLTCDLFISDYFSVIITFNLPQ